MAPGPGARRSNLRVLLLDGALPARLTPRSAGIRRQWLPYSTAGRMTTIFVTHDQEESVDIAEQISGHERNSQIDRPAPPPTSRPAENGVLMARGPQQPSAAGWSAPHDTESCRNRRRTRPRLKSTGWCGWATPAGSRCSRFRDQKGLGAADPLELETLSLEAGTRASYHGPSGDKESHGRARGRSGESPATRRPFPAEPVLPV